MLNLFDKKTKEKFTLFPNISKSNYNYTNNDLSVLSPSGRVENKATTLNEKIGDTRPFPPASKEWVNSIYSYNKNFIKTLPIADSIVNRIIKSYFSLKPLFKQKKSKRVEIRFRRLSLNRILVSKAEMKHTNNKVIITVYLYNRNKKYLVSKLRKIYKTFVLKIPSVNSNTKGLTIKSFNKNTKAHLGLKNTSGLSQSAIGKPKTYRELTNLRQRSGINTRSYISVIKDNKLKTKFKGFNQKKKFAAAKQNFSTKRNSGYKNLSSPLYYNDKIYNYINFTDLTKIRLSRFITKMKNTNLKNKYKTLIKRYYSILTKYKLYSIVSKKSDLNSLNLPGQILNKNLGMYSSSFYKLIKMNNNKTSGFGSSVFKTRRNKSTGSGLGYKSVKTGLAQTFFRVRKNSRKIQNLMQKIRNFYKIFSLKKMYNYKLNTGITANLNGSSFFGNITKMLKKSLLSKKLFGRKKIKFITLKGIRIIKRARKNQNFIIKTLNWSNQEFANYENKYYKRFIKKAYKKEMLYLYYVRMLSLNNNKFKNWFLLGLKRVISKVYNKNVEFNFVNLKYLHLNSDIFTESIATKLKNRQNRLLSVLKKALTLVKLPSVKVKSLGFNSIDYHRKYSNLKNKSKNLNLNLFNSVVSGNNDTLHKLLLNIFNPNKTISNLHSGRLDKSHSQSNTLVSGQPKDVLSLIKHKTVFGVRLEAAGRLSKRLTASRSVFKLRYKGSLKNIDSSYKGMSSVILKGNTKSNIQYTKISSKTRNGSFGLKGWVSGY